MNSLTVYLILQADNISSALFTLLCFIAGVMALGAIITRICVADSGGDEDRSAYWTTHTQTYSVTKALLSIALVCAAHAFMPSTKTVCATLLIPAIANSDAIQKDVPELYTLAVEKLKDTLKK